MNSKDYKSLFKNIKPSKELNDKVVARVLYTKEGKKIVSHKNIRLRIILVCLIILSLSTISVAASTWDLTDIFKGYFKELVLSQKSNKQIGKVNKNKTKTVNNVQQTGSHNTTESLTKDNAFLNTAGAVIESTDTNYGLKLAARGIVGDDRVLYAAIEVETLNGQAFTKKEENNLNSVHFQEVKLQIDHDVLGQYCSCERIDNGTEKGKATFLVHDIIHAKNIKDISGHHLSITFTNLLHTTNRLEDIGMEGNLYEIYKKFHKPADKDYQYYCLRGDSNHSNEENSIVEKYRMQEKSGKLTGDALEKRKQELIKAGLLEPVYYLPKTSTKVEFCRKYPKLKITNMGIKDNILTFNVDINNELDYQYLFTRRGVKLVNRKTGACLETTMDIDEWKDDEQKLISAHFIAFHAITSPEQLKDYYLAIGGNGSEETINKGIWKLDFDLKYKDTSRNYKLNSIAKIAGFKGTIKNLVISPLSIKITFRPDTRMNSENRAVFETKWGEAVMKNSNIILVLKDGSRITILAGLEDFQNDSYIMNGMFPYIIDINQVKKAVIGGNEVLIN